MASILSDRLPSDNGIEGKPWTARRKSIYLEDMAFARSRCRLRWIAVLAAGAVLWPVPGRGAGEPSYQGYRIEQIHVIRRRIFDTSVPSENKLVYRTINHLHVLTRERAIRDQLLFKKGDLFIPDIARETERALRSVLRLRDVHVRPVPVGGGKVDVLIECQDTWSTEPFIGASGSGSEKKYVVGIRERNLGGFGKDVGFIYKKEPDLITRSFSYDDPALLGTRLRLSGDYADTAEGSSRALIIEKPFYSSLTPFSFKTHGSYEKSDSILYENGTETNRYDQEDRELGAGFVVSLGSTVRRVRRLGLDYRFMHHRITATKSPSGTIQDDVYHPVGPTLYWQKVSFITEDHIRLFLREEDFNVGPTLDATVGFSQSHWVKGAANATFVKGQYSQGRLWAPGQFGLATLKEESRYENGWKNARTRLDLEYYKREGTWCTWAGHMAWDQVVNPDEATQLVLGGGSGLRGYPMNEFSGNRLFVANIENRLFFVNEVFHFFGVGGAGFVDTGYAWPEGTAPGLGDIRADYGFGVRIHFTRASLGQVLRMDVAWPTRSTDGHRSPVYTFGTGQVF